MERLHLTEDGNSVVYFLSHFVYFTSFYWGTAYMVNKGINWIFYLFFDFCFLKISLYLTDFFFFGLFLCI